jgi:hypothetical protein
MRLVLLRNLVIAIAPLGLAVGLLHCGGSDDGGASPDYPSGGSGGAISSGGSGGYATGGATSSGGAAGATAPPPPEQEIESSFRSPVSTGKYVWAANPDSGRVALIDALSYDVKIAEAGFGPTYLAAITNPSAPDANVAIVLNV